MMINFFTDSKNLFINEITSMRGICSTIIGAGLALLFTGSGLGFSNIAVITSGSILGLFFLCCIYTGWGKYKINKLTSLKESLENPPGYKWIVSNHHGVEIGELDEVFYLTSKYTADICMKTKLMQLLNYFWVPVIVVYRLVLSIPTALFTALLAIAFFGDFNDYSSITFGQILEFVNSNKGLIIIYLITVLMMYVGMLVFASKPLPGYTNYYGKKLTMTLSKEMPILSVLNSYSIVGLKTEPDNEISEKSYCC